ncbi:4Fe-4S dicluster domain-containing protein [Pannonibacter sp. Pt2-lr]
MGIDIRQGPSIACINCGLCVDACDSTMFRLDRLRGLIDYESWTNIEREMQGRSVCPCACCGPRCWPLRSPRWRWPQAWPFTCQAAPPWPLPSSTSAPRRRAAQRWADPQCL